MEPAERERQGRCVAACVLALAELKRPRRVLAYAATATELPTAGLVDALLAAGHEVAVPVVGDARSMRGRRLGADGLRGLAAGRLGVAEPAEGAWLDDPEIVLLPGLAFDPATGARLGRGGGFYDAYLATHPGALAVGLALEEQLVADLPFAPHDRPIAVLATASSLVRF